jgi:hypothetical protein
VGQGSLPIVGDSSKRGVQDSGKVTRCESWYRRLGIGHDQDKENKASPVAIASFLLAIKGNTVRLVERFARSSYKPLDSFDVQSPLFGACPRECRQFLDCFVCKTPIEYLSSSGKAG